MFFENLRVAGLEADDEEASAAIGHRFESFIVAVNASGGGPAEFIFLEAIGKIDDAVFANVEGVVVEEDFLHLRKVFESLCDFALDIGGGTRAPRVAGNGLRPHAEGAERRAAARRIERDERMKQERDVVIFDFQIALVDVSRERERIEFFGVKLRALDVVDDFAVFAIADAEDLIERFAVREFGDGVIELTARDEVDVFAGGQRCVGLDVAVRADESDLHARIGFFNFAEKLDVGIEADRRGEEDEEFVVFADFDGLAPVDFGGRGVNEAAAGNHAGGIGEPNGIPVGLDFASRGPARACAAVEIFEARRI